MNEIMDEIMYWIKLVILIFTNFLMVWLVPLVVIYTVMYVTGDVQLQLYLTVIITLYIVGNTLYNLYKKNKK